MRYFEKQAKDTKKEVSFGTRMQKHPVATVLMGPAATYGASDKKLGKTRPKNDYKEK